MRPFLPSGTPDASDTPKSTRRKDSSLHLLTAVNDSPSGISMQPKLPEAAIDNAQRTSSSQSRQLPLPIDFAKRSVKHEKIFGVEMLQREVDLAICSLPSQAELLPALHCHSARARPLSRDAFDYRRYSNPTHTHICFLTERPRSATSHTSVWPMPRAPRLHRHHLAAEKGNAGHLRRCSATVISATSEKARHARVDICCGTSCVLDLFPLHMYH